MIHSVECEVAGKTLKIETGLLAKQAQGSCMVSYGDTRVLVTVCAKSEQDDNKDFFPLTVEFVERYYASGKMPGGFFKREAKPSTDAVLSARLIDRPIRPLFPEGFYVDTQIVATVMSLDHEADVDVCAAIGASAALHMSDLPFKGPTAACRVGLKNGNVIINPTWKQIEAGETDMEVFVAGTERAIMMVEGGAREVPEEKILEGIMMAHAEIKKMCKIVDELRAKVGQPKREFKPATIPAEIVSQVEKLAKDGLNKALRTKEKAARYDMVDETKELTMTKMVTEDEKKADPSAAAKKAKYVKLAFETLQYNTMREMILSDKIRIDGRDMKTIRKIDCMTSLLPRAHGSSLFTRGETQVMAVVTLGTKDDEQIVDTMYQNSMKKFMLHYNFPPYSVGETGRMGMQSRREVGHGALAERSVKAMMPKYEDFGYTVRVVCETLESNGSSSMGSVCSASMALMDAGVPYLKPVGGIAMGLIKEDSRVAILSDILGDEDHLGDMDFKVAGTADGVTGIQMDIKIEGVNEEILKTALKQAREGRLHILGEMAKAITTHRTKMSEYAPRITTIKVPTSKIKDIIGSGGKNIKEIVATSGCKIDIQDDGTVNIASSDKESTQKALDMIAALTQEVEVGKTYKGTVKKIVEFGAFIEVIPGTEGLLHVSEIAHERVNLVTDFLTEGDKIEVKVIEVDPRSGKMRLSRKVLIENPNAGEEGSDRGGERPRQDRGDRGPRGPRDDRGPRESRSDQGERQPRPDVSNRRPAPPQQTSAASVKPRPVIAPKDPGATDTSGTNQFSA